MIDNLDYEVIQQYNLVIRATESFSGVSSEVIVNVLVNDMNDCHPKFPVDSYNVSALESVPVDTLLFRVSSRDNDTGNIMPQIFLRHIFEHVCVGVSYYLAITLQMNISIIIFDHI